MGGALNYTKTLETAEDAAALAVAFSAHHQHLQGQALALFLLAIAAVEAGLALGMIVLLYRRRGTLDAEAWSTMHG